MNFVTSTLPSVALVLGILIFIHELGHFIFAKLFGVHVETFSIGFGKRLLGWRRNGTDYRVSLIPLGGYVKMAGENPMEARTGDPGEFLSKPRWQRFVIAIAGPAMNILLAVGLLTGIYMVRYEHRYFLDQPAVIGWVVENSAAEKAGFKVSDRIIRIENIQNPTWEDVETRVLLNPGQPLNVAVQRGDQVLNMTIVPEKSGEEEYGALVGWVPQEPNVVTELEPDMPAVKAGLQVGDEVIAVGGTTMHSMRAVIHYLQQTKDSPVEVTVLRNGKEMKFSITPVLTESNGNKQYRIGFRSNPTHVDELSFVPAVKKSIEQNKRYSFLILELVQKLVKREVSMKHIDGPIGIGRASGEAWRQEGWTPLLALMAAISLNLGIFNLFPIPILDGGVILLLLIESLMRRDISLRIKERIYQAAFLFLILFAVVVIYNDLGKLPGLSKFLP